MDDQAFCAGSVSFTRWNGGPCVENRATGRDGAWRQEEAETEAKMGESMRNFTSLINFTNKRGIWHVKIVDTAIWGKEAWVTSKHKGGGEQT